MPSNDQQLAFPQLRRLSLSKPRAETQTGYSYFGARYYEAGLSIWLSVDPMAHKYPHQSPFTYCSNNPVMLFDPNGMEDYEVDKQGNIKPVYDEKGNHRGAGQRDRLIAGTATYDEKGNLTSKEFETFSNGFIFLETSKKEVIQEIKQGGKNKTVKYNWTKIEGIGEIEEFEKAFKFLAKHTDVEWSLAEYSVTSTNAIRNVLSTSHNDISDYYGGNMALNAPLSLITHIHSHPDKAYFDKDGILKQASSNPSEDDLLFKSSLQNKGSSARLYIFNRGKKDEY